MLGLFLAVVMGGALIWMLLPRKPGVGSGPSGAPMSSNPGWWGWPSTNLGGYPGGTAHSSHSTDCSSGISSDGGGSCGGGDGG